MSDGNMTHHHSPQRRNTSLGTSPPELKRKRTTSTSSTGSLSPIKPKKTISSSEEESELTENSLKSQTSITSVFASLDFKSAKKSYSRLPNLSKKPRLSFEEEEIVFKKRNSTPLSALPPNNVGVARKLVRFSAKDEEKSIKFSTPLRNNPPSPDLQNASSSPELPTTPFRTPKSVKKGRKILENRILGTPDYLAPELLLKQPHSFGVDWWGLGICLYEFMTGIPPFTDETPELVFENILSMKIEWPEEEGEILSNSAVEAITKLLAFDQEKRADFDAIQSMELFKDVDFANLTELEAPFLPNPDDETDTGYFEARNNAQDWKISQIIE